MALPVHSGRAYGSLPDVGAAFSFRGEQMMDSRTDTPPVERLTYSVAETAVLLGVDPQTVRAYVTAGSLRAVQPLGGRGKLLVVAESIHGLLAPAGE
jgi:excisionase family DNA binding protein